MLAVSQRHFPWLKKHRVYNLLLVSSTRSDLPARKGFTFPGMATGSLLGIPGTHLLTPSRVTQGELLVYEGKILMLEEEISCL